MADDTTEESEETLLYLEFSGMVELDWIDKIGDKMKIIGIDGDSPLVQIDQYVFSGEYKDTVGTCAFFQLQDGTETEKKVSYKCKTNKKLILQRVFPHEKTPQAPTEDAAQVPAGDTVKTSVKDSAQAPQGMPEVPSTSQSTGDATAQTSADGSVQMQEDTHSSTRDEIPSTSQIPVEGAARETQAECSGKATDGEQVITPMDSS